MSRIVVNLLQSTGTKGGIEVYAQQLYSQFGTMPTGHEFIGFASRELYAQGATWFPGRLIDSGISGENRLEWARGELFAVSAVAAREKADLIHGPAMLGPLRSSTPAVITFHDLLYFSHPHLMQRPLLTGPVKWMERRAASNAARIITISEYSASALRKYLHVPNELIDVIPLAARATASPNLDSVRRDDLFLAVGQRSPYKDLGTVVRAWGELPAESRPKLVITGSFGEDPLRPIVEELHLQAWVDLRSWVPVEELSELFATATALIDSTLASGFSMPALEAMSIGLPVLLADTEVFREVGADAAAYFAPGDPRDLARMVQSLVQDSQRREQLTALGRARSAQFSWERVARETLDSFERVLADHR